MERLVGETVTEIVLEGGRSEMALAAGTSVPLQVNCYEVKADGKRLPVLRPEMEFVADDPNLVVFKDGLLRSISAGKTQIRVRVPGTTIESNVVAVELVECNGVDILCPERALLQGEMVKITTIFRTATGERDDLLIEGRTRQDLMIDGMVDEDEMGKLSRTGRFTAGSIEGEATIRIRFGPNQQDTNTAKIVIGSQVIDPKDRKGRGDQRGDIPVILMCGAIAPGMEDHPPEQRTLAGGEYHPTIIMMEPPFEHVVWINPNSKEAMRVRQERGSAGGVDRIASKNSLQFLALKCFEILKHLKVRQDLNDTQVTDVAFRNALAQAEMDCADFIDAAFDLADALYKEPEVN